MAKIVRKTASIFGLSAGMNQIAQFGSLAASSPTFSTDPAVIQSLANWSVGWFDGVETGNSPAIEDMNAFCYVDSYQIGYIMQAGIPEWDAGTTYYIGSLANSAGVIYVSQTNANLNNAVTDPTNWIAYIPAKASSLATARTINGVGFDGTANIVVTAAAGTLTGSTLASNVLASSLTSVGTLATLTVTATITGAVSGNAGTATALQTGRTINGTSFNGTANITVTADASTLTNTTLNSTVVASSLTSVGTLTALTTTGNVLISPSGTTNPSLKVLRNATFGLAISGDSNTAALQALGGNGFIFESNGSATIGTISDAGAFTFGATSSTPTHRFNTSMATNATGVGTLTNLPSGSSGNPTGYITFNLNGTVRNIPFW